MSMYIESSHIQNGHRSKVADFIDKREEASKVDEKDLFRVIPGAGCSHNPS